MSFKNKHRNPLRHQYPELFNKWRFMRYKCNTPTNQYYYREGARGISVYYKWEDSETGFEFFVKWALNEGGWQPGLTLLRINKALDYTPENCTFVPAEEQKRYMTNTCPIIINGERKGLMEWSREKNVYYKTLKKRIDEGLEGEELIKESENRVYIEVDGQKRKLIDLAEEAGLPRKLVYSRYWEGKRDINELLAPVMKGEKIVLFGEEFTVREVAEKFNLSKTTIVSRYRKGLRDEKLIEPAKKSCIEIKGELLNYKEISVKYNIPVNLLKDRYHRGKRGEELIYPKKK